MAEAGASVRVRAYWYGVQHLDFWPWSLPSGDTEKLVAVLSKHAPYAHEFQSLRGEERDRRAAELRQRLLEHRSRMESRFRGWTTIQDGIAAREEAIEFRRAGAITYDLFTGEFGTEKAADVKRATDLLELRPIYDVAIIVSGDQDYVPAVQAIKDSGKRVINVCFLRRDGSLLPGGARRLNHVTDRAIEFPYHRLRSFVSLPVAASQ